MFRFIIFTIGMFLILSLLFGIRTVFYIVRLIFGGGRKQQNKRTRNTEQPASQDDRIITYKKKEFEISAAEDVDFVEIKDNDEQPTNL